jgi:hypothetical protein
MAHRGRIRALPEHRRKGSRVVRARREVSLGDARKLQASSEVELLRSVRGRCGSAAGPSASEVEQALESGFASLMALEARLQGVQTAARTRAYRAEDEERSAQQLLEETNVLRDALTELQAATSSDATSPLTAGFVLPSRMQQSLDQD